MRRTEQNFIGGDDGDFQSCSVCGEIHLFDVCKGKSPQGHAPIGQNIDNSSGRGEQI